LEKCINVNTVDGQIAPHVEVIPATELKIQNSSTNNSNRSNNLTSIEKSNL
jgi:hypothetical protein